MLAVSMSPFRLYHARVTVVLRFLPGSWPAANLRFQSGENVVDLRGNGHRTGPPTPIGPGITRRNANLLQEIRG